MTDDFRTRTLASITPEQMLVITLELIRDCPTTDMADALASLAAIAAAHRDAKQQADYDQFRQSMTDPALTTTIPLPHREDDEVEDYTPSVRNNRSNSSPRFGIDPVPLPDAPTETE